MITRNDLLGKLRTYKEAPDDENILYKQKIKKALMSNPCLLYALNEKNLNQNFLMMMVISIGNGMKKRRNTSLLENGIDIFQIQQAMEIYFRIYLFQTLRQKYEIIFVIK